MNEILKFIVKYCSFLWKGARYQITDSLVSTSFGSDAYLTVSSDAIHLRFVDDRGQLSLEFQPARSSAEDWYSVDIVRRLSTGERMDTAELDAGYARFLEENLVEIESRFADPDRLAETEKQLRALERKRAKELFG